MLRLNKWILMISLFFLFPFTLFAETTILFESDGSSLDPFYCDYYLGPHPSVSGIEGIPAPSIEYQTDSAGSFNFAPYTIPGSIDGKYFKGSMDFMMTGPTNRIFIVGFGFSISPDCNYIIHGGPADGRYPFPYISYFQSDTENYLRTTINNASGERENREDYYVITKNEWHHVDFTLSPDSDGSYIYELKIDGEIALTGRSYGIIYDNDNLGAAIGIPSSYAETHVNYDNIRVEMIDLESPYFCSGFQPPLANGPVKVKKNRVIPVKAQLFNDDQMLTDADITASPVIQVTYQSTPEVNAVDVTDDAYAVGFGTEGNEFEYNAADEVWQFNLKTKNYTAPGTYYIEMVSGDESEYTINSCQAEFVVE